MTGALVVKEIRIDAAVIDPDDPELLADMVLAAVNEGLRAAQELANVSVTDAVGGAGSANFQIGSTPSSPCAAFSYNLVEDGGGVPESTWSFSDTAATTGTLTFNWQYVGFHAVFDVTALLQVFSGSNTVTLYSASAATCCSSPSGGFNVQGTASIAVTAGQPFGFTVGGSNFDSNATLNGTLYITDFTPPAPPPHP